MLARRCFTGYPGSRDGRPLGWLDHVRVEEVVHAPQVTAWITRNVVELPLAPAVIAFLRENVIVAHEFLSEDNTPVAAILPRAGRCGQ